MVTATEAEGMPFVTTWSDAAPKAIVDGMSNCVDTTLVPVDTPELKLCVRQ